MMLNSSAEKTKVILTFQIQIEGLSFFPDNENNGWANARLELGETRMVLIVEFRNYPSFWGQIRKFNNIDFSTFGTLINTQNVIYKENRSVTVNFNCSKLMNFQCINSNVFFFIDYVKIESSLKRPSKIATFYLNESGFSFVQNYYRQLLLFDFDNSIDITEYRQGECQYDVLGMKCTPRFILNSIDNYNKEINIRKDPVIQWNKFDSSEKVIEYTTWMCMIASLFFSTKIDFKYSKIKCNGIETIVYKRPFSKNNLDANVFLYLINDSQDIDKYIRRIDFAQVEEYYTPLLNIVSRLINSRYLDDSTRFLVLFSIIENCMALQKKERIHKFSNYKNIKGKYFQSLECILEEVKENEKADFKTRWNDVWKFVQQKPAKKEIFRYLEFSGFNINAINNHIYNYTNNKKYNLVSLRNDIIHGKSSFKNVDFGGINLLLYTICNILIFKILGIKDIDLYKDCNISDIYN